MVARLSHVADPKGYTVIGVQAKGSFAGAVAGGLFTRFLARGREIECDQTD